MEAISKGVPMVVLPAFGDQLNNAKRAERMGYGKQLKWVDVTTDSFV